MKMNLVLPEHLCEDEVKLLLAFKLYETGKASLGQAAKVSGLSKRAFIEVLGRHRIPVIDYSADDLKQECSNLAETS